MMTGFKGSSMVETLVATVIVMSVFMVTVGTVSQVMGKMSGYNGYEDMCRCRDSIVVAAMTSGEIPETVLRRDWGIMTVASSPCGTHPRGFEEMCVTVRMDGYTCRIIYLIKKNEDGL